MHNRSDRFLQMPRIHSCKFRLCVAWLAGLTSGIAFSYCTQAFSSLMRGVFDSSVSIVSLGTVLFLPYLLTAFAVLINRPFLLVPLAFIKAFFFGACAASVDLVFGAAGWLIRMLLLFSDSVSLPLLFWLWMCCTDSKEQTDAPVFFCSGIFLLLVCGIDYLVIAPFLASMI